jgi:hypothetical protein
MENSGFIPQLFQQLYLNVPDKTRISKMSKIFPDHAGVYNNISNVLNNSKIPQSQKDAALKKLHSISDDYSGVEEMLATNPFKTKLDVNGVEMNPLKYNLGAIGKSIQAHPLAAAGMGALGVANIAGLTDDDKIGGQLVGGLGGGILASTLNVNPVAKLAIGMGGGALGSLFDKLRAKKEAEQQATYQQQSY